ncbi:MAG: hypothetical protein F6K56_40560 [Moorea sp. SIO3G5]|nr:hypothetical protein [Moorena sp. SIO3G5]
MLQSKNNAIAYYSDSGSTTNWWNWHLGRIGILPVCYSLEIMRSLTIPIVALQLIGRTGIKPVCYYHRCVCLLVESCVYK